jgi:acetoin utilization deacetylase AcuC-like enzyme
LVYSPEYAYALSAVPMDPLRGERIFSFLMAEGLIERDQVHRPSPASVRDLLRVHTEEYLESLHEAGTLTGIVGVEVRPDHLDRFLALQRSMVGGTMLAAELTRERAPIAINLGGGLHHAHRDRGSGYCLFNDVAIAIRREREDGFEGSILVIDLDLHDGDGTRSIFADDESVFTYSICSREWGDTEALASLSLELGDEVEDAAYLAAIRNTLPGVVKRVAPRLVFFLMGSDPAITDGIGQWRISAAGMLERDRLVLRQVLGLHRRPRLVGVLAGGYGPEAWRYSARSISSLLNAGRAIEPPTTNEMTLDLCRRLAEELYRTESFRDLAGDPDDWTFSEQEILGPLGGATPSSRFLDVYSQHALEIVLERSGLFDRLRGAGFPDPTLELDLAGPTGHTARVWSDHHRRELLSELRLRRDRRTVSGFDMLNVEWLLLQNPRVTFTERRPRLTGQKHPGLGMLRDVVALLILVCERLGLDGLVFVPSHFHLAAQSSNVLRFADPDDEGRFRALRAALSEMPLADATRALSAGKVRLEGEMDPYDWQPAPMVLPLSEELIDRVGSAEFRRRAGEAYERYRFSVEPTPSTAPGLLTGSRIAD